MTLTSVEAGVIETINNCRDLGLPPGELEDMASLARAGEPGIALENLCTQLVEYDCVVPDRVLETIRHLGRRMGISKKYWDRLKVSSKDPDRE